MDLVASIVTAAATVGLAVLAYVQIRAGQAQAKDAKTQSDAALTIAQQQAAAAVAVVKETREAAQRQWQPYVIAHAWKGPTTGDGNDAAPDEMAVRYFLQNEGTGPAFNVEPRVEVGGTTHTWNDWQYRSMSVGEATPPIPDPLRQRFPDSCLVIPVKLTEWSDDVVYCARFDNLLGERFEVRNFPDPKRPAEFRRLPSSAPLTPAGAPSL